MKEAFLVNVTASKVVGKFPSIAAAESLAEKAGFETDVMTADDTLEHFTIGDLTALYNSVSGKDPVKQVGKTKAQARTRLFKALQSHDWAADVVGQGSARTRDIEPLSLVDEVKPIRKGTRLAILVEMLHKGATLEELASAMDYPAEKVWRDHGYSLQRKGYGRTQKDGKFVLVLPKGVKEPLFK